MSIKDGRQRTLKIEKDLKDYLLHNLKKNTMLGGNPDKYRSGIQGKSDSRKGPDSSLLLNVNYPSSVSPEVGDLQFHMVAGCQDVVQQQNPGETNAQFPMLSHKQLVEGIDRLNSPSPSQLTQTWVRTNSAEQIVGKDGQVSYDKEQETDQAYNNDIEEIANWDDRQDEGVEITQQQLEDSQQPATDILGELERSLHEHIDDELNSLRVNLHSLVADQQVHLRQYLTPTQYSEDVDDIDVISNQDDFSGPQATINLDDTGWSSDCMQSSCSTVNELMKLEEASPDSALGIQDDMTCQQQQESVAVINRLTEDCEIQNVLLQLQTSAAVLSHTLRRQEYSTS